MTPDDVIKEAKQKASEWLQMTNEPETLVSRILADKILKLEQHIEYLQRRLEHVSKQ